MRNFVMVHWDDNLVWAKPNHGWARMGQAIKVD